eukprot:10201302-Ditylum_brightwellii.AAC.1
MKQTITKRTQKWQRLLHLKKEMARLSCAAQEEVQHQRNESWGLGNEYRYSKKGKMYHTDRTTDN